MPRHVSINVHGTDIHFYDFISSPDFEAKARGMAPFFRRMPGLHVQRAFARYVIFVIRLKPEGEHNPRRGRSGGTWLRGQVPRLFRGHETVTGVPDADLQRLVIDRNMGLIGIPQDRWSRPLLGMKNTLLHETGHAVDYTLNLSPPCATVADFRGVRPVCGGSDELKRHAVEAYARLIFAPARICRDGDINVCSGRVAGVLRRAPAFAAVPDSWWDAHLRAFHLPPLASFDPIRRAVQHGGIVDPWAGAPAGRWPVPEGIVDPWSNIDA